MYKKNYQVKNVCRPYKCETEECWIIWQVNKLEVDGGAVIISIKRYQ